MSNSYFDAIAKSLSVFLSSTIQYVFSTFDKCTVCELYPATNKNRYIENLNCCDHCTAEFIYDASTSKNLPKELDEIRSLLANEEFWLELQNAEHIRKLTTYIEVHSPEKLMKIH